MQGFDQVKITGMILIDLQVYLFLSNWNSKIKNRIFMKTRKERE